MAEEMITIEQDLIDQISMQSDILRNETDLKTRNEACDRYTDFYKLYLEGLKETNAMLKHEEEVNLKREEAEAKAKHERKEDIKFWIKTGIETVCTGATIFLGVVTTKHSVELGRIPGDPTQNGWLKSLMKLGKH